MAALAGGQVPGGAAAAAIRPPPPPLRCILMSGCERPGHGSGEAAGKMAAVSAPYAKYPPPPPLRPPGGKGKRVGFKPPPPPAQTPSSLSQCPCPELVIAATISPATPRTADGSHRDGTGPDLRWPAFQPGGSAAGLPHRIDRRLATLRSLSGSRRPADGAAGSRLPAQHRSPLPLNPALPLPFAARGGVPSGAPMPPPRAPSLSPAPAKDTQPGRLDFKKRFLPQELAPNVPWR